jgi:hypothetical protein
MTPDMIWPVEIVRLAVYDRCLYEGRRAYLAGYGINENPYQRGTDEWCWWREGYEG